MHVDQDFPGVSDSKESAFSEGDPGFIPGSGRSPGEGNGYPLQYSFLENSMDRGTWWITFHEVTKRLVLVDKCECSFLSGVQLFATAWTAAHQAPLSMEFSRKEYWSGLPFPSPVDLPDHKWWMSLQKSNFSGPGL